MTIREKLRLAWARLFEHPQWNIGIVRAPIHAFLDPGFRPGVTWFPLSGRDGFLADPFGVATKDGVTVVFEYYDYATGKGRICTLDFDGRNFGSRIRTAIEAPLHLSYPCLIESGGQIYCVPESYRSREIAIYKAERFPDQWTKIRTLLSGIAAVDPTVFHHNDRWWLMCTNADSSPDANLFLWHAADLLGPWTPHARNPVKSDIRSARPGGTPFVHEGQLYRPAQDCSLRYGWRIAINRVTRLTPDEFSEELVTTIDPPANGPLQSGRHTLSAAGDFTLIDGHRFVFVPRAFRAFLGICFRDAVNTIRGRSRGSI